MEPFAEPELTEIIHYRILSSTGKVYEVRSTQEQYVTIITALMKQDGLTYPYDVTGVCFL